jgi:hypothetical protein
MFMIEQANKGSSETAPVETTASATAANSRPMAAQASPQRDFETPAAEGFRDAEVVRQHR